MTNTLLQWVKNGPEDTGNTFTFFLAWFLYWRVWAMTMLGILPWILGMIALDQWGGFTALMVCWFSLTLLQAKIISINPKYELTRNY